MPASKNRISEISVAFQGGGLQFCSQFHSVFRGKDQHNRFAPPPLPLAPPLGNPRSATATPPPRELLDLPQTLLPQHTIIIT